MTYELTLSTLYDDNNNGQQQEQQNTDGENDQETENDYCQTDNDCEALHICKEQICVHKPLFPLTYREFFGLLLILILVGFSQAGGIGGGLILLPILIGLLKYDTKQAVAITFILIFGGACGNFINNQSKKTENNIPLIWYDLVVISVPFLLSGAIIGVAFNHLFPPLLIMCLLIIILQKTITKTYANYKKQVEQEKQSIASEINIPLNNLELQNQDKLQQLNRDQYQQEELNQIIKNEQDTFPKEKFLKMISVLLIVVFLSIVKGGKGINSLIGISPCGWIYWAVNISIIFFCVILSKKYQDEMIQFEEKKERLGYNFNKYGNKLDKNKIQETSFSAFFAGGVGGLLGLGGGIILTPKWLDMGIPSDRTAATATFTVCFTSFISFFTSLLAGRYHFYEAIFFWVISFIASFAVSKLIRFIVGKYRKKSILILILLIVIGLALFMLPIIQMFNLMQDPMSQIQFGQFC